jgi:pyrroloquinoline quinone (PQQ) biosynthesis protein C
VADLEAAALRHRAVRHPYLEALAEGHLPDPFGALADFARQYQGYSAHFPRFLSAVISRLENPAHRQALLSNLLEESGQYNDRELALLETKGIPSEWIVSVPHPELFLRFRLAVAGDVDDGEDALEVVCWRETLLALLGQASGAEAVGILGLGTEFIVATIYQPFLRAIAHHGGLAPRDTVFFPLHTLVDDAHQLALRQIAIDFAATEDGRADLAKGMHKALALRDSFWSWLHERARSAPGAWPAEPRTWHQARP